MAYDVSTLGTYTKEVGFDMLRAAIYEGQTSKFIRTVTGAGSNYKVPTVSNTITLQNQGCNLSSSGVTTLGQASISLCPLNYTNDLCDPDLRDKYTSEYLPKSEGKKDVIPFEAEILGDIASGIAEKVDSIIWNGDSTLGCTGFIGLLTGTSFSSSTTNITSFTAATTTSNIMSMLDEISTQYPFDNVNKKSTIWLSAVNYKRFLIAGRNANYFNYKFDEVPEGIAYPGAINIYVRPTAGITSNNIMICAADDNLIFGTTNEKDSQTLDVQYDNVRKFNRISADWKQGVTVAFPSQVVVLTIA